MAQILYQDFGGGGTEPESPIPGWEFRDMDEDEVVALFRKAVSQELESRDRIDAETHKEHHAFIEDLLECSRRRRKLMDAIMPQVLGWGIIAILGWIGYAVYQAARSAVQ